MINNIFNNDVLSSNADLILIPVDSDGYLSPQFFEKLQNVLGEELFPRQLELGSIHIETFKQNDRIKNIAFCCTFDSNYGNSSYTAIRQIGAEIGDWLNRNPHVKIVASPLLGTGAGRLVSHISSYIFDQAFSESAPPDVLLNIYILDKDLYNQYQPKIEQQRGVPTLRLKLEVGLELAKEDPVILEIIKAGDFYYELARDKFKEFNRFETSDPTFFKMVRLRFKQSKLTFREFLPTIDRDSKEFDFLELCGQLIAYIDFNAYLKNLWNKNIDKRVLAKSGVNQTHWVDNLIKYKESGNNPEHLASSIKNSLLYLSDPLKEMPMLSNNHRKMVFDALLLGRYEHPSDLNTLFNFFKELRIVANNNFNDSVLLTRILYHPAITGIWLDQGGKVYSHDITFDFPPESDINQAYELIYECFVNKSTTLSLGNCGIMDLLHIPELFECEHLEELYLSNEWSEFDGGLWRRRKSENYGELNKIKSIPSEIGRLKNLKKLMIGGDWSDGEGELNRWGITNIEAVLKLKKLEFLNVSNNFLTEVRSLHRLPNLQVLHLNNNRITSITGLTQLPHLRELYLSNNYIDNLDFLKGLNSLYTLDLHSNNIKSLTAIESLIESIDVTNTKWEMHTINVASNPLAEPSLKTISLGRDAILRYFREIKQMDTFINTEIKLILVGNSEAGKTTLAKYLDHKTDLQVSHQATHWLEEKIIQWDYDPILENHYTIRLFDFGGHDYYHDTHHIFFTHNSLYILVWDRETDHFGKRELDQLQGGTNSAQSVLTTTQDYPIKYWLDSVSYFTREVKAVNLDFETHNEITHKSSLLLLQNKVSNAKRIKPLNNESYSSIYPFIYESLNVDLLSERNTEHMMQIINEMLKDAQLIGEKLPKYYVTVKDALLNYEGDPVLSILSFNNFCNTKLDFNIDLEQTRDLAEHLKHLGLVVWFPKNHENDKIYVDKNWLIKNIRKALDGLSAKKGRFTIEEIRSKVDRMTDIQLDMLIAAMIDYKMIFKHPYKKEYIAPLYLPEKPAPTIEIFLSNIKITHRRFQYVGYIQKNVILQLFQKYGQMIPGDQHEQTTGTYYYWKNGLIIKGLTSGEIVLVNFDMGKKYGEAHIDLFHLGGPDTEFIVEVTNYIREINKDYEVDERVTLDGIDYISLKLLEKYALQGRYEFTERTLFDSGNPETKKKVFKLKDYSKYIKNMKKLKVAISYSKIDIPKVHAFLRYLNPLVHDDLIELPWYCTDLEAGCEWNDEIERNFKEADIVFFMMSDHFFDTAYILDHEIPKTIDRYRADKSVKVVPILLVHYPWSSKGDYNLQDFTGLPYQGKPISDYKDQNMAWYMVSKKIRIMIEKSLDPGKTGGIDRELKVLYERQVEGKLDNNS